MPTQRDVVLAQRAETAQRFRTVGGVLDDIDPAVRADPRLLYLAMEQSVNQALTSGGARQLYVDDPPAGARDGTNRTFQLSRSPRGKNNIVVRWTVQATGVSHTLTYTDSTTPVSGEWTYDTPTNSITVGEAPVALDGLCAIYIPRG